jgi:formate dehydrogenase subunit gamma
MNRRIRRLLTTPSKGKTMSSKMIRRHSPQGIFLHWFNTACWLFLLFTGIGLLDNKDLQPLGMWWVGLMRGAFGGPPENLLLAHEICGILWASVVLIYSIVFIRSETIPFLKEIFSFSVRSDLLWLLKKMTLMTAGSSVLRKLGYDSELPEQGFYNVGQKLFAVPAVLGGFVIVFSGLVMTFETSFASPVPIQWAILIHFTFVFLVFAGLLVHIFMASIASGEKPAFLSMFTGFVPEEFARHHNTLWYQSLEEIARPDTEEPAEPEVSGAEGESAKSDRPDTRGEPAESGESTPKKPPESGG